MNTMNSLRVVAQYFNGLDFPNEFLGSSVHPLLLTTHS